MKDSPFFSATKVNPISDYMRYRNTRAYLRQKSMEVPDSTELMQTTGYAKPEKFRGA